MFGLGLLVTFTLFCSTRCLIAPMKDNTGEADVNSIATHVLLLEQMFETFRTERDSMKAEIATLKSANSRLEQMFESFKTERESVKADANAMKSEIATLKSTNSLLEQKMNAMETSMENLNISLRMLECHQTPEISFEVRQAGIDIHMGKGSTLHFDDVTHNIGGAYHNTSGIFTAPVAGTYIFWAHVMVGDAHYQRIDVINDGKIAATGYAIGQHYVASITAAVEVGKNDDIWFQTEVSSLIRGEDFSSYGGFLLAEH